MKNHSETEKKITNFGQFYKEQCVSHNVKINNSIYHGIKGTEITVNLDMLTEQDLATFSPVLQNCMFTFIKFTGNPMKKSKLQKKQGRKTENISAAKVGFQSQPKFQDLIKQIGKNLSFTTETKVVCFQHLRMSKQCLQFISDGLEENKSIKEFYINNCDLDWQGLEILSKGLAGNEALTIIDLSNNILDGPSGRIVGKILSTHSQRRDDIVWVYSLRGEEPEEDISLKGVYEVNMSNNKMDSNCVKDMCYFLQYDNWVRSLNFQQNNIGNEGVQEINYVLENNESLISLDLRFNPGFQRNFSQTIFQKLLRNVKNFKKKRLQKQMELNQKAAAAGGEISNGNYNENQNFNYQYENNIHQSFGQSQKLQKQQQSQSQEAPNHFNEALIQEEDEDFQEPSEMEKMDYVMNSLYNENKLNLITNKNCNGCKTLEKKLIQAEYKSINLKIENVKLKNLLNKQQITNQQNSWSAIQPNNTNYEQNNEQNNQNNSFLNNKNNESEEVLNKIEGLMLELTRMMDGLEGKPNDVTNQANVTYQMSNTLNTNNNTYQLYNQNNTFSNFLGQQSTNTSNIIPQPFYLQQQQQQQGIQQHQQQPQQQQLLQQQQQQLQSQVQQEHQHQQVRNNLEVPQTHFQQQQQNIKKSERKNKVDNLSH